MSKFRGASPHGDNEIVKMVYAQSEIIASQSDANRRQNDKFLEQMKQGQEILSKMQEAVKESYEARLARELQLNQDNERHHKEELEREAKNREQQALLTKALLEGIDRERVDREKKEAAEAAKQKIADVRLATPR